MSSYAGVTREVPIVPFNIGSSSMLVRGMIVQWNPGLQIAMAWVSASTPPLGVCTSDPDLDLWQISVFCGKGCSVLIKLASGSNPDRNDFLFYSGSPGLVSNGANGPPFARAIGLALDGFVEAIIC